jgi:uncharacterized membrane protein (UPF0127 family)
MIYQQISRLFGDATGVMLVVNRLINAFFAILTILLLSGSVESAEKFGRSSLSIVTDSGTRKFNVEVASTPEQRALGLQGRTKMPPGTGMLFDFRSVQMVTMWMKNTYIPLDMIFIAADGTILTIVEKTVPHSLMHISSGKPVRGVLEVRTGTTNVLGIRVGDSVVHDIFIRK